MRTKRILLLFTIIGTAIALLLGCSPAKGRGILDKDEFRRSIDELYHKGDLTVIDRIFSPDCVRHEAGYEDMVGLEVRKQSIIAMRSVFPDLRITIDDILVEDARIAIRTTSRGTHKAVFKVAGGREIPATGKQVTVTGMVFHRVKDGKIVESFAVNDTLGMMQQLGLIPVK